MSKQLDAALEALSSCQSDLELCARGQVVDAKEVSEALKKAIPDTVEFVCLQLLAKYYPYENTKYNRPTDVSSATAPDAPKPVV